MPWPVDLDSLSGIRYLDEEQLTLVIAIDHCFCHENLTSPRSWNKPVG